MKPLYRSIIRIYPRPWRERYAAEYLLFLEQIAPGWHDLLNLLFAALDERLCSLMNLRKSPRYGPFSLLHGTTCLGVLLLAGCIIYGLSLIHDRLPFSTLAGGAVVLLQLLLWLISVLNSTRTITAANLRWILLFGLLVGLVEGAFIMLLNLLVLNSALVLPLSYSAYTSGCLLFIIAGALVAQQTGLWRAGIFAAAWSGLLAALLTLLATWFITFAFMDVMDRVSISNGIRGITDWTFYNVDDNLGGTFFTLLIFPAAAIFFGSLGALIGKRAAPLSA